MLLPAVSGIHFHPFLPLLATASGQRRYPLAPADDESDSSSASDRGGEQQKAGSSSSSSDTSSSSDSESQSGWAPGASLSALENVLQVWRCSAALSQTVAEAAVETAEGEAAAEDTDMAVAYNGASYEEAPAGSSEDPRLGA